MNRSLITAARGDKKLDLAIENVQLVNVFTGEIYPCAIGISEKTIVHVTKPGEITLDAKTRIDGQGKYAVPGFIDTHVHIESSMLTPSKYAEVVLPHGTTTVVTDPHEIGNVLGTDGVRYMVEAAKNLDLRILTFAPSCVPAAPSVETAGADFTPEVIEEMLRWDGIDGLAEVMNYVGVIEEEERMMGILEAAERSGKIAQGHAPTVSGRDLSAYLVAGIDSDHECRTGEEALEKLQAGMFVEVRESSFSFNMAPLAAVIKNLGYVPNVCFCSDDVLASDLLKQGHINHVVRRAIEEGISPINAIRFATLNAANRLKRTDIGAIAPGRIADIVLLDDLCTVKVSEVFTAGEHVVAGGKLIKSQEQILTPATYLNTIDVPTLSKNDFTIAVEPNCREVTVRVIEYDYSPGIPTNFMEVTLPVKDGEIDLPSYNGKKGPLNLVGVFHRHGKNQNRALGILAGFGVTHGAVATTVAHDSHNLTVLGVDKDDMALAANELKKGKGGMLAVKDGKVIAHLPLPLAGLMSLESAETLTPMIEEFVEVLQREIMPGQNPIMRLIVVTLPVIPKAKITDIGLVDVDTQELLPLVIGQMVNS
ncbi:adenine deaminase [Bacillus kwashiorkori]|uniref:adenine deaminase n=1 Tax=Bacillus kwashiorkori TaxID=1522318 RepID=UPI0007867022|nr:adenine deaminase [Bacillus kwashiorkori]